MTTHRSDDRQQAWIAFAGDLTKVLAGEGDTGGAFGLLATRKPVGGATPIHEHGRESETVYVLSGELSAQTVEGVVTLSAGDVATLPSMARHRLANLGEEEAQYLLLCHPAGFEAFVAEAGSVVSGKSAEFVPPSQSDIARLAAIAPRYAITLLGPDALPPIKSGPQLPAISNPRERFDAIGIAIEVLAELGDGDDSIAMISGVFQSGTVIPLHSHIDSELFYIVEGELELYRSDSEEGSWIRLGPGEIGRVASNVRHAVRNRSDRSVVAVTVTTGRLLRFLRTIARPPGSPPGQPTDDEIGRMIGIAKTFGYWNASPAENAAIGLLQHRDEA